MHADAHRGLGDERTVINRPDDWYADIFAITLADVGPSERRALWDRVRAQHEAWAATVPRS